MIREDAGLIWQARKKMTGANCHNAVNLIRSYQMAVEMSARAKNKPAAREYYLRCDSALRQFAGYTQIAS